MFVSAVWILMGLSASLPTAFTAADTLSATAVSSSNEPTDPQAQLADRPASDDPQKEVKRYKIALLVLAVALFVLFWFMLILALVRMGRFHRRRMLGKKSEPTEYVDAWSQYRLNDEAVDGPDPDQHKPQG